MAARPYACVGVGGCISGPLQVNALYLHLGYLAVSIEVVATLAVHWNHLGGGREYQCRGLVPSDSNYKLTLEQRGFELCNGGSFIHTYFSIVNATWSLVG